MVEVVRNLWVHIAQPLLQQGSQSRDAQVHNQVTFGHLQEDSRASLSSLYQNSITHTAQKFFLIFRHYLCLSPLPAGLAPGTTDKNLDHLPSGIYENGSVHRSLKADQSQLPQPLPVVLMLQTLHNLHYPSLASLQ